MVANIGFYESKKDMTTTSKNKTIIMIMIIMITLIFIVIIRMPFLTTCCCGFSVRTGTKAIAVLSLVKVSSKS